MVLVCTGNSGGEERPRQTGEHEETESDTSATTDAATSARTTESNWDETVVEEAGGSFGSAAVST